LIGAVNNLGQHITGVACRITYLVAYSKKRLEEAASIGVRGKPVSVYPAPSAEGFKDWIRIVSPTRPAEPGLNFK
jgi:hypothetical protein